MRAITPILASLVTTLALVPGQQPPPGGRAGGPPAPQQAQGMPQQPATALVLGRVVDAGTGRPVVGATVRLSVRQTDGPARAGDASTAPRAVMTGPDGQFVFHSLPAGSFPISVTAPGYLPGSRGQRRPGGPAAPLDLDDGEKRVDVVVKLWKYASISGAVTDESGEPLVTTPVRLFRMITSGGVRRPQPSNSIQTDDRGFYRFTNLTPGDYLVAVPQGVTSMPLTTVEAFMGVGGPQNRAAMADMERRLSESFGMMGVGMQGLRIGDQQIQSNTGRPATLVTIPGNARPAAYRTAFFQQADTSADAQLITLGPGEERTAVDLQLKLVPTFAVQGSLTGPEGPMPNTGVRLMPYGIAPFDMNSLETAQTATNVYGHFTFPAVPPGQYTLVVIRVPRATAPPPPPPPPPPPGAAGGRAVPTPVGVPPTNVRPRPLPTEPTLSAQVPVSVGEADVTGLAVTLRPGARVRGRLVFEGTQPPPRPEILMRATVNLNVLGGSPIPTGFASQVTSDGNFETQEYLPGRYVVSSGVGGWFLRSVAVGGRALDDDVLEIEDRDISGVTLTFTDRPTEITGTVRGLDATDPDASAAVIIFPAAYDAWIERGTSGRGSRTITVGAKGSYRFSALPPGNYLIAAVDLDSAADAESRDLTFFRRVAAIATRLTLGDGEKRSLDLTLGRVR